MSELIVAASAPLDRASAAGVPPSRNPAAVYLKSLRSPESEETMRRALRALAGLVTDGEADEDTLPWHLLRAEHAAAMAAAVCRQEEWSPATMRKHLSGLRQVLRWSWRLGWIDAEERDRAIDGLPKLDRDDVSAAEAGRAVRPSEFAALFSSCAEEGGPLAARDAALLALLYGQGLRRAEAARLDLADLDLSVEPAALVVHGKRSKTRILYCNPKAALAVEAWLAYRGAGPGPLFRRVRKGGQLGDGPMTGAGIYEVLAARARKAKVPPFSPHDLRRTFAGDMLEHVDMVTVSKLMGHASVSTTGGYDRRGAEAKQRAAGVLHIPYGG